MNTPADSKYNSDIYLYAEGNLDDILHAVSQKLLEGNDDLAASGLNFLLEYPEFLKKNEYIRFARCKDRFDFDDTQERLLGGCGQYYAALSSTSLLSSLIFTSDKALRVSFQSRDEVYRILKNYFLKNSLPFPSAPLNEYEGEKCILLHAAQLKIDCFTEKDIKKNLTGKCPLYYECRYVKKQKCCCREKNISDILNTLEKKRVITRCGSGYKCVL